MPIICDTHILLFWEDAPQRLSKKARNTLEQALGEKNVACSDISFWEIAMLFRIERLRNDISALQYMRDIVTAMSLDIIPVTPEIAVISQQDIFPQKDPADRLIAATAINQKAPLITADKMLRKVESLKVIW